MVRRETRRKIMSTNYDEYNIHSKTKFINTKEAKTCQIWIHSVRVRPVLLGVLVSPLACAFAGRHAPSKLRRTLVVAQCEGVAAGLASAVAW